jgi:hypothetical protein
MIVNNSIINGLFQYVDGVTFTENDILFDEGKLYHVKADVSNVTPTEDVAEEYYQDYFIWAYNTDNIAVKSDINKYLQSLFPSLTTDGVTPVIITSDEITQLNKSGVYKVPDGPTIAVFVTPSDTSFMIKYTKSSLSYLVGTKNDDGSITWGTERLAIVDSMTSYLDNAVTSITALQTLLKQRISQYDEIISRLDSVLPKP